MTSKNKKYDQIKEIIENADKEIRERWDKLPGFDCSAVAKIRCHDDVKEIMRSAFSDIKKVIGQ